MTFLTRAIWLTAAAFVLAVMVCVALELHRLDATCGTGFLCRVLQFGSTPSPASSAPHGCAVFGGEALGCQNFPEWSIGSWDPPDGVKRVRVLIMGGGGGGAASGAFGKGGGGGGSGRVISGPATLSGNPLTIIVGSGGQPGQSYSQPGQNGGASVFGGSIAHGGGGGGFGGNGGFGYAGGGGGGGGTYVIGYVPGNGGNGNAAGGGGMAGENGGGQDRIVLGGNGGDGISRPLLSFSQHSLTPGDGGIGGAGTGSAPSGCGGGGGGGGGGILLDGQGPSAMGGQNEDTTTWPCQGNHGYPGQGGSGFGAGGGGGGNFAVGSPGGTGASGLVYLEW